MEAPTRICIRAIRDACNRMVALTDGMPEATINDSININYAIDLRRRVEGIVEYLEREQS